MTDETDTRPALPPGWAWATLGEICELVGGITVDAKRRGDDLLEVPYLRVANVQRGALDLSQVKTIRAPRDVFEKLRLRPNDVLINEGGDKDKVGRGWVWSGELDCCIHQNHVFRARPRLPELDGRYISAYGNEIGRKYFFDQAKQTTNLASISMRKVAALPVPLAPLAEQRRIMARVEELFGEIEAGEQELEKANEGLSALRSAMLNAAVTGQLTRAWREANPPGETGEDLLRKCLSERRKAWERNELAKLKANSQSLHLQHSKKEVIQSAQPDAAGLPELPKGWVWTTVGQLGSVSGGLTKNAKRQDFSLSIPYLRVANVQENFVNISDIRLIGLEHTELERTLLQVNDLLFVEGNGSPDQIGRVAVWKGDVSPCVHQNHIIKARFSISFLSTWLLTWFMSPRGREIIRSSASSTSGLHTLSISKISKLPVPLPSAKEIDKIISAVKILLEDIEAGTDTLVAEGLGSTRLRQSILAAAFSGKLVPQDPNDEPAEALLARLRAAKAGAPAPNRRGRPPAKAAATADAVTRPADRPRGRPRKTPAKETQA